MIYLDYERYKFKYHEAQMAYDKVLTEREALFQMTQPKGIDTERDKVQTSATNSLFADYLVRKEQSLIDERLTEAEALMNDRESLLERKGEELRGSKEPCDRIYLMRYVERRKIREISKRVMYSEAQVYRILGQIRHNIEKMRENERFSVV